MASEKYELLKKLIQEYRREEIRAQLKKGIMKEIPEEEKIRTLQDLVALRDPQIIKILSRELDTFDPQILDIDCSSWQNRDFIADILDKYPKKFDWNNDQVCEALFDLACRVTHPAAAERVIRQKKAVSQYYRLAGGADDLFALLKGVKPSELTVEQRLDIILEAATAENEVERLQQLETWGYDLKEKNSEGATVNALLEEKIKNTRYPKNRSGELQRKKDRNALSRLQSIQNPKQEEAENSSGMSPKKRLIIVVLIICAAVVVGSLCYHAVRDSGSSDGSEESELSADSETGSAADSDEVRTVQDGDTVNIDYTGYVDGVAFDGGSTNGAGTDLTIGSGSYIDDFEEQLIGYQEGDEVTVEVTFPEDYGNEELNGKDATFEVTINQIYD